jgi:hypothetical protein
MAYEPDLALQVTCPICAAEPGKWCRYVNGSQRNGLECQRLHFERTHRLWLTRPVRSAATTKPNPVLPSWRESIRREDEELRTWLRQNVHLLLKLN